MSQQSGCDDDEEFVGSRRETRRAVVEGQGDVVEGEDDVVEHGNLWGEYVVALTGRAFGRRFSNFDK